MNIFRFAPSPTGFLHVGGARTAIYNWLLAQQKKGKFLLRIEDTDQKRSDQKFTLQILNSLKWLGINWDDDPVYQSQRQNLYLECAYQLLNHKKAYRCFCSPEELKIKREFTEKNKLDYVYDKNCRYLSDSEIDNKIKEKKPFTIRLKTDDGIINYKDNILGKVESEIRLIGDFILVRSDNSPVYQLAVVVDDHDMGITHVVRGADHLSNTLKQILIFEALNWQIPQYAHLPLILGPDKKRLSKRHGATSVNEFKENGFMAEALLNYLSLLGWSPGDDQEIFSKDDLIQDFSLNRVNNSNAVFDQAKLKWMNAKYISELPTEKLLELSMLYQKEMLSLNSDEQKSVKKLANLTKIRAETMLDFDQRMQFFFAMPKTYNEKGVKKYFNSESAQWLVQLNNGFNNIISFKAESIEKLIREIADQKALSAAKIIHPLRLALTGDIASPGIFEIVEILGRKKVNNRILKAVKFIESNNTIPKN